MPTLDLCMVLLKLNGVKEDNLRERRYHSPRYAVGVHLISRSLQPK